MSDSQRPNPPAPSFEVPDLELEPVVRPARQAVPTPARQATPAKAPDSADQSFGASFDFGGDLDDLDFERSAQANFQVGGESAPRVAVAKRTERAEPTPPEAEASWPTGRAIDAAELELDPRELAILADYGDPKDSAPHSLAYAYRVFTRQRELKQQLGPVAAECKRAQLEREATLAELSRTLRPGLEQIPEFRRFLAPLVELEQRAAERGKALNSINAQLGAETGQFDAELANLDQQLALEQEQEREVQHQYDDREANAKRAEAKWKRVQIEIRAVTQVAEHKLGPQGGRVPDEQAAQLADLRQRAEAMQPEITHARTEFEQAKQVLAQLVARRDALRRSERLVARKKQALGGAYQKELNARAEGVSEIEIEQRAALAELARAVLAARGTLEIPEPWLERVRSVSERADQLTVRAEMLRRAIVAYDHERARRGVRLACTAVGLVLVLFAFKLIF
jgi:hypothetical protein